MTRMALVTFAVLTILSSTATFACFYNAPISVRIARINADQIDLATVVQASYSSYWLYRYWPFRMKDWNSWHGSVVVDRHLLGRTKVKQIRIGRTGSTAACDDGIAAPKKGDLWVIYTRVGEPSVRLAYPLEVARKADAKLDGLLASNDIK